MAEQDFERLLAVIKNLEAELNKVNQIIATTQQAFSKTGGESFNRLLAQQKIAAQELNKELAIQLQRYRDLSQASKKSGNIPHPKGGPSLEDLDNDIRNNKYKTSVPGAGASKQTARQAQLEEIARKEKELLDALKNRVKTEQKFANARAQAEALGFDVDRDLYKGVQKGTGGIEQLRFRRMDAGGSTREYDSFVSPSGRATPGISNQFRTFGQGVIRDIGELTKWSLALAAVYGPMQKVGELTQQMIENQTKLAEASIAVSSSFLEQGEIFDIAADSANRAGEAVTGVIDAFTLAYRAAGGGANEVERLATAQMLLDDSLVLSKLSTLDQATAIDTLSAALRQTSGDLTAGTELLDKWVRVTQVANVDMASLATGFAVVGDAAEAAGLDADELNGVLAAIAETGVASGKELANTGRAIIAGFQSDTAQRALEDIGISARDASGNMRGFLEIMQEIYNLRNQGIISDSQFSKLTLALGGGSRRQAAYSTLIENFDRAFSVSGESRKAGGESEKALESQLATVQTSLTELDNAFDSLAQTMGQEGGFLSIIQGSVEGTSLLVRAFDTLVGSLGKATPALAAFLATAAILRYQGRGGIQNAFTSFGQSITTPGATDRLGAAALGQSGTLTPGQASKNFIGTTLLGSGVGGGIFQGIAASLIPALLNATNKEDRFGGLKAGANVIGGITGGVIGALVAGSPLIGAAIGTAISEVFITKTVAYSTDLFNYAKGPALAEAGVAPGAADPGTTAALEEAEKGLYKSIGFGDEALGRFITGSGGVETEYIDKINEAIADGNEKALEKLLQYNPSNPRLEQGKLGVAEVGIDEEFIRNAFASGRQIEFSPENMAYQRASDEARQAYDEALSQYQAVESVDIATPFSELTKKNADAYSDIIDQVKNSTLDQISNQRLTGDIKGTQYTAQSTAAQGFDVKALQYYSAFGQQFMEQSSGIDSAAQAFEAYRDIIVYGSAESVQELTALQGQIEDLYNLLADPEKNKALIEAEYSSVEEATEKLEYLQELAGNLSVDVYKQAGLSRLQIPNVQGDVNKPLSTQDFQSVLQEAGSLQDQFYQGFLKLPDEMYDGLKESWDDWAQIIEESGEVFFETVSGIDPQFFQQAMAKLLEENKLKSQAANPFGIQQVDLPGSKAGELQSTVDYFSQYLATNFPQYEQKPEDIGIIFNDYVTSTLHGDNLAIKLALEKLVDINQKQLDGQYNIPEGATFWVPLTAAYYRNKGGDGAGMGDLDTSSLDTSATNLDGSATALNNAADYIAAAFEKDDQMTKELLASLTQPLHDNKESEAFRMKNDPEGYKETSMEDMMNRKSEETGPSIQQDSGSFIDKLIAALSTALTPASQAVGNRYGQGNMNANPTPGFSGGREQQQPVNTAPVSKLDLKIAATTTLTLDGRILASALQNYLAQDLLRTEASQGTITKRYVI